METKLIEFTDNDIKVLKKENIRYITIDNQKYVFSEDITKNNAKYIFNNNHQNYFNNIKDYITYEISSLDKVVMKYNNTYHVMIKYKEYTNNTYNNYNSSNHYHKYNYKNVYLLEAEDHTVKVGVTDNFVRRKRQLENMSGKIFINEYMTDLTSDAYNIENDFKKDNKSNKISGEWFNMKYKYAIKKIKQLKDKYDKESTT